MMFLDAFTLNKPEIFIGNCASKLDEETGEIKDEGPRADSSSSSLPRS